MNRSNKRGCERYWCVKVQQVSTPHKPIEIDRDAGLGIPKHVGGWGAGEPASGDCFMRLVLQTEAALRCVTPACFALDGG